MKQIKSISIMELSEMAQKMYGSFVKGVVDVKKDVLMIDAEMHADIEAYLLENGSRQEDLWGINLYPAEFGTDKFIEYDSMINIRPRQNNMNRNVNDENVRKKIQAIVKAKVTK